MTHIEGSNTNITYFTSETKPEPRDKRRKAAEVTEPDHDPQSKKVPTRKNNAIVIPDNPWAISRDELLEDLCVYTDKGLDWVMVSQRNEQFDATRRRRAKGQRLWSGMSPRFTGLILLLALVTVFVSLLFGQWGAGVIVVITLAFVWALVFWTKKKTFTARPGVEANLRATVRRDEQSHEIQADKLLPGDVVLLQPGDVVAADLRLIKVSNLQIDEAALTGDSTPVSKQIEQLKPETPLTQRTNMAFKGTSVVSGSGEGIVVASVS